METQFVPKEQGNKTIAMMKTFNVIIEQDNEGFYVASVPELKGCHTQAKSLDILLDRIKEAIALCREVDDSAISNQFVGFQRISVSV
jgi:predicted RNase H-like HicB family nuclease